MKNLIAIACTMALASCDGPASEPDQQEPVGQSGAPTETVAGTYVGTTEDGVQWSSVINADGTYHDTMGGEVIETGNWTETDGQACFIPDAAGGEEPMARECFGIGSVAEDGSVVLTTADGEQMRVQKLVD